MFLGHKALEKLSEGAQATVHAAFRPKTRKCYQMLFRNFVAFCHCAQIAWADINIQHIMAYLQFLIENNVSVHMVANHISALKANFVMYGLDYTVLNNPRVSYFLKSIKINRPLAIRPKNIITLPVLKQMVSLCDHTYCGKVFKAVFLLSFFAFLRISNIAPHSYSAFDPTRNLTPKDIRITKTYMHITLTWTKTIQTRDKTHVVVVPRLPQSPLCPVAALQEAVTLYSPNPDDPLFQIKSRTGWKVLIDSRIRKVLSKLNLKMGFTKNHFTFHAFRRSGATLAYDSHVPIRSIKNHGSWTSDCVWTYIQSSQNSSRDIASSFASLLHDA